MKKVAGLLLLLGLLTTSGCATPAGKFKESDLVWQERTIQAPYQEVYKRLVNAFRANHDYVEPDAQLYPDLKEAHMDMYLAATKSSIAPWVVGMIDLKGQGETTDVRVGINEGNPYFSGKGYLRDEWLKYAEGR